MTTISVAGIPAKSGTVVCLLKPSGALHSWLTTWKLAPLALSDAMESGHLNLSKWIRQCFHQYCSWDAMTFARVVKRGHLPILQWARANGCPWDQNACIQAVRKGYLEILRWLIANGCP